MSQQLGHFFKNVKVNLTHLEDTRLVLPRTDIGVEFEWEGVKTAQRILDEQFKLLWEEHKEPSLHDNGREFAVRVPMFGKDLLTAIKHMTDFAKEQKWKVSLRTGFHAHMDCRDITHHQLIGIGVHYAMWEPAIYAWVGGGREANNFCAPWYKCEGSVYDAAKLIATVIKLSQEEDEHEREVLQEMLSNLTEGFHKYAGLNLRPLKKYGSIEFRQMIATHDFNLIVKWLNIILNLKRAALDSPESSMAIVGLSSQKGLDKQIKWLFGEETAKEMLDANPNVLEEVRTIGVPNAIEFLSAINDTTAFIDNSEVYNGKMSKGAERWLLKKEDRPKDDELRPAKRKVPTPDAVYFGGVTQAPPVQAPVQIQPVWPSPSQFSQQFSHYVIDDADNFGFSTESPDEEI